MRQLNSTHRSLFAALLLSGSLVACSGKAAPPANTTAPVALTAADSQRIAAAVKASQDSIEMVAMKQEAKITDSAARATAMKAVPKGVIKEGGLEREDGKLTYSFDMSVAGKDGIDEVVIDAITGKMISKTHETPGAETKEAAADSAKAKPDTSKAKAKPAATGGGGTVQTP